MFGNLSCLHPHDSMTDDLFGRAFAGASCPEPLLWLIRTMVTRDPSLYHHGSRTASYAALLGQAIGFSLEELTALRYAALLHDIGKLTVPRQILQRDGPLTAEEYALVQSHPRAGAELLAPFEFLRTPAVWIAHHHERWDGSGYPYGLRGPFIPLGSRILAVADTFDAITSDRPYRVASGAEAALGLLQVFAGSQLDPELVRVFVRLAPGLVSTEGRRSSGDNG